MWENFRPSNNFYLGTFAICFVRLLLVFIRHCGNLSLRSHCIHTRTQKSIHKNSWIGRGGVSDTYEELNVDYAKLWG